MMRPPLEVADIVRVYGERFRRMHRPSLAQQRVLRDIAACRTAELGGHVQACDGCGHQQIAYNSCRNRHCPKCQAAARAEWMTAREQELLPVPYFHMVFTLPEQLGPLALQNKRVVYGCCFARRPTRCSRWLLIPSIWERRSASSPCCTRGART
jgi:hypothetical protein